uniref:Uncharacterized protein n=1 Tax=Rhodosorus marinus TaxID=101924 RepID=A0A7S3ED31_9RHOD|mmetsp:Transcript_26553/g.103406  ORF Transcript_26553/g.103406 Transcript_26553/m.103406 type:complete len:135 (+) Transcript_26553:884-1288(+)
MEPQSQKDLLRRHIAVIESLENFKTALEEHIEGCSQQLLELQEDERELMKVFESSEDNDQTIPEHYQLGFVAGETCSCASKHQAETGLKTQEPVECAHNQVADGLRSLHSVDNDDDDDTAAAVEAAVREASQQN